MRQTTNIDGAQAAIYAHKIAKGESIHTGPQEGVIELMTDLCHYVGGDCLKADKLFSEALRRYIDERYQRRTA
ncbi:MAG: hypothetical protein GY861_03850 [bacterium]|nr:hypothetical protein [bacterium]